MSTNDPERWRRIEEVLDLVLDAAEADRERVLAEATAGDVGLRAEVERLLAASEQAGASFEEPPLLVARSALADDDGQTARDQAATGDVIGAWRIVRLLGRGGMGAVHLAERADGAFQKKVALKIVKRGMDTDEIIRRFHDERQILASLEHSHIAGLIDGGVTPDGLPYFAMELAEGEPIDRWCDGHTLTVRERLRLFQTVCEAVQYAHSNLVIHRDLKPANVLVSEAGVKLLDFGIAKMLGPEGAGAHVTQAHEARLTPRYAAPEQIRGLPTTTATDVYSLGVILYELLTGRQPYRLEGRTFLEIEQIIGNVDPWPPSIAVLRARAGPAPDAIARQRGVGSAVTLQNRLRGDLDAILLKALAKNPDERYISAAALSEDIQRHLDGQPVRAHPPSRRYRIRKFVKRNRAIVALGTLTAFVLLGASVATSVMASLASQQRDLTLQEAQRATAARDFLISVLSGFDPDVLQGTRAFTTDSLVNRGLLHLGSLAGQPELQATVMNALGQVAFNLSRTGLADSLYRGAFDLLRPLGDHADLAVSMMGMGEVLRREAKYDSAEVWFRDALAVRRRALPAGDPRIAEAMSALAFALYNSGGADRLAEADRLYSEILSWPELPGATRADARERLGDVYMATGRTAEAVSLIEQAMELRSRELGEDHPANARAMWGLVQALLGPGGDAAAAVAWAERSLGILRRVYGERHRDVAWALLFLGRARSAQGELDAAVDAFRESAGLSAAINSPGHFYTGRTWFWLAEAELARDSLDRAEAAARESLRVYDLPEQTVEEAEGVAVSQLLLGRILGRRGLDDQAEGYLRAAFEAWTGPLVSAPNAGPHTSAAAEALASLFARQGRPDSAAAYRARVVTGAGS